MPVRSLNSSVMRWPSGDEVDAAVRTWARRLSGAEPSVRAIGYFGSFARGASSVGSDVDLVVITERSVPLHERVGEPWAVDRLPVPAEVLVYNRRQWQALADSESRFYRTLRDETIWVVGSGDTDG